MEIRVYKKTHNEFAVQEKNWMKNWEDIKIFKTITKAKDFKEQILNSRKY